MMRGTARTSQTAARQDAEPVTVAPLVIAVIAMGLLVPVTRAIATAAPGQPAGAARRAAAATEPPRPIADKAGHPDGAAKRATATTEEPPRPTADKAGHPDGAAKRATATEEPPRPAADNAGGPESAPRSAAADPESQRGDDDAVGGLRIPVVGPPIGAVLAAAYGAAGIDHSPGTSWTRRARLGGLVPWITVRTTRDTSWQDAQSEVGHGTSLEARATWRLDRLVFDGHELQVATIEAARRRERRRVAARVIRAYFTWRRAAGALAGPDDDRAATRLAEAIAELDALTDGWFSEELLRTQRGHPSPHSRLGAAP